MVSDKAIIYEPYYLPCINQLFPKYRLQLVHGTESLEAHAVTSESISPDGDEWA